MADKTHEIYIIIDFSFPNGLAGASRVLSYAKGFISHDTEVTILCIRKTESYNNVLNKNANGIFHGINYKYLSRSPIKSKYLLIREVDKIIIAIRLFFYSLINFDKNSTIIFYSLLTHAAILLRIVSFFKGYNLLKEENEHPLVRERVKTKIQAYIFRKFHYRLFDGILVITQSLSNYFKRSSLNKPILHVPMLVDLDRFDLKVDKCKSITYCGMLSDTKDGLSILLKSFAMISPEFPDYKLRLIGEAYSKIELLHFKKLIKDLLINEKVVFLGRLLSDGIPTEISKSTVLVLPRPDSIQAQNGFPTKLGEYLATGIPVVVTSVGEIPDYLTDGKDAFIAIPGDIESLSDKLKESLTNPERSVNIGKEGRITAEKYFDYKKQTRRILSFIREI